MLNFSNDLFLGLISTSLILWKDLLTDKFQMGSDLLARSYLLTCKALQVIIRDRQDKNNTTICSSITWLLHHSTWVLAMGNRDSTSFNCKVHDYHFNKRTLKQIIERDIYLTMLMKNRIKSNLDRQKRYFRRRKKESLSRPGLNHM